MNVLIPLLREKTWPKVAFLLSAALLAGAYAFQYIGGLAPCQMCYWQRHAHKAVLAAALLAMLINLTSASPILKRLSLIGIAISFIVSAYIAAWHMGVEYKWWAGPQTCLAGGDNGLEILNSKSLLDALSEPIKAVPCDEAAWRMFGISMAGYNAIISALAALLSLRVAFTRKPS